MDKEINNIEYQIRKREHGIKMAHKNRLLINEPGVDYDFMIGKYVGEIKELRDKLEGLTGRRQPSVPKWPV